MVINQTTHHELATALEVAELLLPQRMRDLLAVAYIRHAGGPGRPLTTEMAAALLGLEARGLGEEVNYEALLDDLQPLDNSSDEMLRRALCANTLKWIAAEAAGSARYAAIDRGDDDDAAWLAERAWQLQKLVTAAALRDFECLPLA